MKFEMMAASNYGGKRSRGIVKKNSISDKEPLFSIITVVYNNIQTIERCIKSVINQSYNNLEYIIIDGQSTDGTLEIIKDYENEIDLWVSEKDKGIYDAINKGINYAKGYTLMLHSDDFLNDKNILKQIAPNFKSESTIYFGRVKNYNEFVEWQYPDNKLEINNNWLKKNPIPHQSVFIFHKIHRNYLFDQQGLSMGNDRFILTKLSREYEVTYLNELITCVQLGGDSNNWKNLSKVLDYVNQSLNVDKMLDIKNSLYYVFYLYAVSIIKLIIFKLFGRKNFYKIFYKKYLKK